MKLSTKLVLLAASSLLVVLGLSSASYGATKTDSDAVVVNANVDNFISISHPADVTLPTIVGTGGQAEASATWNVKTNNDLGYKLEVFASGSPALTKGTDSFADYSLTPQPWVVNPADSAFGFSYDGGVNFLGFNGTTPIQVHSNPNETAGEDTTLIFRAEVGANHLQASGAYTASVTVTATTL
jgi:hypothetical protein